MTDHSFQLLACKYLGGQVEKLETELSGARGAEDIECVHQSRVASRRLRAGISFFDKCFPSKNTRKWLGQVRKITRRLGQARDRDVQIEFIKEFVSKLGKGQKKYKRGVNRLLRRLKQSREGLQPKVAKSVDKFNSSGVLADMHGEIEKALFSLKDEEVGLQSRFVFQNAREAVSSRLQELFAREGSLKDPDDKKGHHKLRIAAKRLRYTLEICDAAFEGQLEDIIKAAKHIQTCLGDIHDLDVWDEFIEEFIAREKARTIEYFGHSRSFPAIEKGLDFLRRKCGQKRRILFNEFLGYWKEISKEGLWGRLLSIIDSRLSEYPEPQESTSAA